MRNAIRRFNYFQHRHHTCGVQTAPNDSTVDVSDSRDALLIVATRKVKYRWLFIMGVGRPCRLHGVTTTKINLDHVFTRTHELNDRGSAFSGLDPRSERPRDLDSTHLKLEHDLPLHVGCHTPSNRQNLQPQDPAQSRASDQDHHRPRVHCRRSGTRMGPGLENRETMLREHQRRTQACSRILHWDALYQVSNAIR